METTDLDIVSSVFEHRLHDEEVERLLGTLSQTDRSELLTRFRNLLMHTVRLLDVAHQLGQFRALHHVLPRFMTILTDTLHAERSSLFLYDEASDELFSRVALGDDIEEIRFPAGLGVAGWVFRKGEELIIDDAYADDRFNPEIDRRTGYRTRNIIAVPLRNARGKVVGVAEVLNKRRGGFDDRDMLLLRAMCSQACWALENARLFEEVEAARKEEAKLFEVTNAISSELNLNRLLQKIVSVTTEILNADRSTLFLFDEITNELWSRVAEGIGAEEIRFPATAGLAGACFTSGTIINIPDAYADPRFNREVDRRTGYRTRNILCIPVLNRKGQKVGVMQVLNRRNGPFTKQDEALLQAFAAQASIALENARLFEDVLNARNYNESILQSLTNAVITLDTEFKVTKVNEAARKLFALDEDVVGQSAFDLFGLTNPWLKDALRQVHETNQPDIAMDQEVLLPDSRSITVNLTTEPLVDVHEEPIGLMLVAEDVTREKRVRSTMARYMTKEVMDKLIEGGDAVLGGTAQEVTILFSDIRDFTPLSESLGARDTVALLNSYFTEMVDVILDHGGMLDKYIGDAIMAVFGAPFKGDRDADNAVLVAAEMIRALRRLNEWRAEKKAPPINIGIGLSCGEVVAGNIGSPRRMDYTVIGDSVNLASRLESANKFYGTNVLMGEGVVTNLHGKHRMRELDLVRVKGKSQPVRIFELLEYHTSDTFPNMNRVVHAFEHGLRLYRERDWERAADLFGKALELHPKDGPSTLYLRLSRHYMLHPPGDDWTVERTLVDK
ncbi:MAG: GAF domain-containing protein [Lentisphaeria bacterium]|nr:GAF domain-containing protein [Lentisphaeria bacterium]